jgi:hypothetical protein
MAELSQFIVLKHKGRWSVRATDVDQTFAGQLVAIKAGIELAKRGRKKRPSLGGPLWNNENQIQEDLDVWG